MAACTPRRGTTSSGRGHPGLSWSREFGPKGSSLSHCISDPSLQIKHPKPKCRKPVLISYPMTPWARRSDRVS